MKRQKRFEKLEKRPVHLDGLVQEWDDEGFVALNSKNDPAPSIKVEDGKIVELDGKKQEDFDLIDKYIAEYGIDATQAPKTMKMSAVQIANMLCDPNVPRQKLIKIANGLTPAKAEAVISEMNFAEMIMATQKMRPRKTPMNQCHITNTLDNPVQLAADAAEAAARGFAEQET